MVAASRSMPACSISQRRAPSGSPAVRNASTAPRSSETSHESSAVRAGASPIQNGIVGGAVAGVAHAHHARLDLPDLPRVGAEQEDVARHRLDGPVLVDGADERVVGLGDDAVVAGLGDGAAGGDGGEARALAPAQLAVDRVVVHVRAARAATGRDAVAHEVDDLVELRAGHVGVGRGAPDEGEQVVGAPFLRADLGDDLLGDDVEREMGELDGVEAPGRAPR